MRRLILLPSLAILVVLSSPMASAQGHESWSQDATVYEVNVRQYTPSGTFQEFGTHLDRLEELGVEVLWFMPIHPIGEQNRLGSLGSYYSVRDYYGVNPEFGTAEDFRAVVDEAHARGMRVLLDWVANHTSWDNGLTETHPEWYVTDAAGEFIPPPGTNWTDVIELDYAEPGLRAYMIDAVLYWMEEFGVDGFRFDAVDFVPHGFWEEATAALVEANPDVFLLAEGNDPDLPELGFDASFGWGLYGFGSGVLARLVDGTATATTLRSFLATEASTYPDHDRLYFTSNHDENSWYGTTRELFGEAAESFAVLTFAVPGLPLVYSGQEAGLDRRLAFFDKDLIDWQPHPNAALYRTLIELKEENAALRNGSAGGALLPVSTTDAGSVLAFVREKDGDRVFAAFNLTAEARTVTLNGGAGSYRDVFTGEPVTLTAGASLALPAWGYVVYASDADGTDAEPVAEAPPLSMGPVWPNPARTSATVAYALADPADVRLTLHDVLGREVRLLSAGPRPGGDHSVSVDVAGLPGGVYTCRLQAGGAGADAARRGPPLRPGYCATSIDDDVRPRIAGSYIASAVAGG
jgi:glycosidase